MSQEQHGSSVNMQCPQCGASDVIEIKNRVDEVEIDFFSCHKCEERWWDKSGKTVPLLEILEIVRKARA
jgi:transposase-like protein